MATEEPRQEEQGPLPRTREAVDWWLRKWGHTEPLTREDVQQGRSEPLTREDVERLIQVNGGAPEGLHLGSRDLQDAALYGADLQGADLSVANLQVANLSGAKLQGADLSGANLQGADLSGANLQGARLYRANLQGAYLSEANLQGANLSNADLQGTSLSGANLQGAYLHNANLQGADLRYTNLDGANFEGFAERYRTNMEGVRLYGATITETTKLRRVLWGKKMTLGDELDERWGEALNPYRDLKQWHQRTDDYDTADRFQYREWECKRKLAQEQRRPLETLELWLYRLFFGYGTRPWRVIPVSTALVLLFALLYMLPWTAVDLSLAGLGNFLQRFGKALYFSVVSFTAVGYGGWLESEGVVPAGWTRYLGVVESLLGIPLIALFLVTFTRKLVR